MKNSTLSFSLKNVKKTFFNENLTIKFRYQRSVKCKEE